VDASPCKGKPFICSPKIIFRPLILFLQETNYPINPRRDELLRPQRDLDRACLKALVNLLHRLPLQPPETAHDSADVVDARSQMFCSYFTLFLSLLDSSQLEGDRRRELQTVSLAKDDASSFQDLAIQALSNLLSANVDVGLKFSLEIGYHDDLQTRTAFMHVLTNILTQGTEFGALGDSAIGEKYEKLIDVSSPFLWLPGTKRMLIREI